MPLTKEQFNLATFYNGEDTDIHNPFLSECLRFRVSPEHYGFEVTEMGGGCQAWVKEVDDQFGKRFIVITDESGCNLPDYDNSELSEIIICVRGADFDRELVATNLDEIISYFVEEM